MKLYLVCLFLNGLKDAERDVRTLKMMQGVGDHGLLKIPNSCQIHKLIVRHCQMTLGLCDATLHHWVIS